MKLTRLLLSLICVTAILLPMSLAVEGAAERFSDVGNHWGEPNISNWWRLGLVGGYPDGTFRPDNIVNRAEFVSFLNRAFGYVEESEMGFGDINRGDWFYAEAARSVQQGYIAHVEGGAFEPYTAVSRIEAAEMLYKALKLHLHDMDPIDHEEYHDIADLTPAQQETVHVMASKRLMVGSQNRFNPAQPITRAETIAILDRAAGAIFNEEGEFGTDDPTTISGNASVSVPGVTLTNMVIEGDLYLTEGIAGGTVTLHNVTVNGTAIIGVDSSAVVMTGNTSFAHAVPEHPSQTGLRLDAHPALGGTVEDLLDEGPYGLGSEVSLLAKASPGYEFAGWITQGALVEDPGVPATLVTLSEHSAQVTARFVFSNPASFSVSHSEGGSVSGSSWSADEELTVRVLRNGEVAFSVAVMPDAEGDFTIDPRSHAEFSVADDDEVQVLQGELAVSHAVGHLAFTDFSAEANTVTGSANAEATVRIIIFVEGEDFEDLPKLVTTASSQGDWLADFAGIYDIQIGTYGVAEITDVHGNSTIRYWHVPATTFSVFPLEQRVTGFDWTYESQVTVSRNGVVLGSLVIDDEWGYFSLENIEVEPGDVIVVTDGVYTRSHTVTPLQFVSIDRASGIVSGLADPDLLVTFQLILPSQGYGPPQYADVRILSAAADGTWQVDYGSVIPADYTIQVEQADDQGDMTVITHEP